MTYILVFIGRVEQSTEYPVHEFLMRSIAWSKVHILHTQYSLFLGSVYLNVLLV